MTSHFDGAHHHNEALYRPCVGIMLINNLSQAFVANRLDTVATAWQMPQGGIEIGEDPWDAGKRELLEETSISSIRLLAEHPSWLYYDIPQYIRGDGLWLGKFKGQKQKWFLAEFCGLDSEINIKTKNPEFSRWKWSEIEDLADNIVDFKKEIYQEVIGFFSKLWSKK